jgi:sulfite exporter TauE/SafE
MVGTIVPIVYGKSSNICAKLLPFELIAHCLGGIVGGVVSGLVMGGVLSLLFHRLPGGWRFGILIAGVTSMAYSLRESGLIDIPVPQSRWQVPRKWLSLRPAIVPSTLWGFCLGLGVLTRFHCSLYAVLVWICFHGSGVDGAVVMGAFGLVRTLPPLFVYAVSRQSGSGIEQVLCYMGQKRLAVKLLSAFVMAVSGGLCFGNLHF